MKVSRSLVSVGPIAVAVYMLGNADIAPGQVLKSTSGQSESASARPGKLPDDVAQVLWWLPEETEAVVVSRGTVPIMEYRTLSPTPKPGNIASVSLSGYAYTTYEYEYQDLVAMHCIEPLGSVTGLCDNDLRGKMLQSFYGPKTAVLFLKAAWWEEERARGSCDIVVFRDSMAARIVNAFSTLRNVPRDFDGVRVLQVDLNTNFTSETYQRYYGRPLKPDLRYLAAPRPNVYFATTNSRLMQVLIKRMKHRCEHRALPADLPEWRQFDPTVLAWGVRHYRRPIADRDPTSMLRRDANAQGLVFFGDKNPSPCLCFRYVSKSEDAGNRFLRLKAEFFNIKDTSRLRQMSRINADCVELRLRINAGPGSQVVRSEWTAEAWSPETTFNWLYLAHFPFLGFSWPDISLKSE